MKSLLPAALVILAAGRAGAMAMSGALGPQPMTIEASGTSWQPESTPHEGLHVHRGDWMLMAHGQLDLVTTAQGRPRGGQKNFVTGWGMFSARRPLGPGTAGFRFMPSADPAMGPAGYPLLLQTGETADGTTKLVDRQHPHDFFMELAATYSVPVGEDGSAFGYFALPGEPALGPSAFMHRGSAVSNPEAPLTHHWIDSTHIAMGVVTLGATHGAWKLEGSAFHGREPDRYRWDVEEPRLDSFSGRLTWNPHRDWSLQASGGRLREPEALEPGRDVERLTASVSNNARWLGVFQQTTLAFGRNRGLPGRTLGAWLLETSGARGADTVFARAERVEKDELFNEGEPLHGEAFAVGKLSVGYAREFAAWKRSRFSVGGALGFYFLPEALRPHYGDRPVSGTLFLRARLG